MKKIYFLLATIVAALTATAATEAPAGSGIYYDWDADGVFYLNWTDPSVVSGDVVLPAQVVIRGSDDVDYIYEPQYAGQYAWAAFWGNTNITSLTIEAPYASIPGWAFEKCSNLTSVTIADGLTSIGEKAFSECTSLANVTLPSTLQTISASAFWGDPIVNVTVPASVQTIGGYVWGGNTAMQSITFNGVPETIGEGLFGADYANFMVGVSFWNGVALKEKLDVAHAGLTYKVWDVTLDETLNNATNIITSYADAVTVNQTLKADGVWNVVTLPVHLTAAQIKATFGDDVEVAQFVSATSTAIKCESLNLSDADAAMEANKPYLLKVSSELSTYTLEYVWLSDNYDNLTVTHDDCSLVGTLNGYEATVPEGAFLVDAENNIVDKSGETLKGLSGYLTGPATLFDLFVDDIKTGIDDVRVDNTVAADDAIYDLMGRRLNAEPASGIYIKGGKKYLAR